MASSNDYPIEIREFGKAISNFSNRYYDYDIFSDFIDYMICCLLWDGDQEVSDRLKSKYKNDYPKFFELYKAFFVCQQNNLGDENSYDWYDSLGQIYETIASRSKASRLGQFFTPKPVCDFMAAIVNPIPGDEIFDKKGFKINDCACGSGRTLLAFNKINPGHTFYAEDLDQICAKMTAINLAVHGCKGQVCNMNSLMPDDWYFGYQVNPMLYQVGGIPHIIKITKEQSFTWNSWMYDKSKFMEEREKKIENKTQNQNLVQLTAEHCRRSEESKRVLSDND